MPFNFWKNKLTAHFTLKKKIIILGAKGLLGRNLVKSCQNRKISFVSVGKSQCDINLDLSNNSKIEKIIDRTCINIIINATGLASLDKCEKDYDSCYKINTKIVNNIIVLVTAFNFLDKLYSLLGHNSFIPSLSNNTNGLYNQNSLIII